MLTVAANVPVTGSYSSALARIVVAPDVPPTMSTFPFCNKVAVCPLLAVVILPVVVNFPVTGSYSSALVNLWMLWDPPAKSTIPLPNNVAV
jgi:uncharacterized membrane protein